jgi:DNA-binding response OmpR family regulator
MKILIIDDDNFFQKFYSAKLTENGFEVQTASDGEEGIAKIASFHPEVILLDIIMPKKNGLDVLSYIGQHPELKAPILVFSTLGNENDIAKAKQLGATDYVNKTFFDFDNLLKKINTYIK